jgi:hypothetical protein
VAFHETTPFALQPGRLKVQLMLPFAVVADWNHPDSVLVEKEPPVIAIDVAGPEVTVAPVGQFEERVLGKLMP